MKITSNGRLSPRKRRAAFTLMEVLVVVAILVVLAGVGGVIFLNVQQDAYKDNARIQIETLTKVCQTHAIKNGMPENLNVLVSVGLIEQKMLNDPWGKPYQYSPESTVPGKPKISTTAPDNVVISVVD